MGSFTHLCINFIFKTILCGIIDRPGNLFRRSIMRYVIAILFATILVATNFLSGFLPAYAETKTAIFAGGCFWCVESDFDHVKGVSDVVSGYVGGESTNPTYQSHEGFVEGAQISYDPAIVSYAFLVDTLLRTTDPTDAGG